MIKYKLYTCRPTKENIELAEKFRFHRITLKYILIYAESKGDVIYLFDKSCYCEITESVSDVLSAADKDWLFNCNMDIIAEQMSHNEEAIAMEFGEQLEKIEEALKEELDKQSSTEQDK